MSEDTPHRILKEKQRQERATLILQAAEAVFAERGYRDTSMDEIAARVGVAKGTVYQHFASKEELVFALFESELEAAQHMVEQAVTIDASARVKLETIIQHTYQGILGKRMQLMRSIFSNMDLGRGVLKKRLQMRERMARLATPVSAILEEGKKNGEFDPDTSTAVMTTTFFSILSPLSYEWLVSHEHLTPDEVVTQVGRIFFQGISTK